LICSRGVHCETIGNISAQGMEYCP
jgi:hypothetical protein